MNKVLLKIEKDYISFSKYNREINEDNLNNTNVINVKNLKFTEEYIISNLDLVSTFVSLITLKFNINKVVIKNLEIAECALALIENIPSIKTVKFTEDTLLNYTISLLLARNSNLEYIECYNIPDIMFYRIKNSVIKTRAELLYISKFFELNRIKSYSDIYNKEKIVIPEILNTQDINDIIYFFETNKSLKKLYFERYSHQNLITILNMIKSNNFKNIDIVIYESQNNIENVVKDSKNFNSYNKRFSVNIKIKYSKEYKERNTIKELNLKIFKIIIITCVFLSLIIILVYKYIEQRNTNQINKNIDDINRIVDNTENDYSSIIQDHIVEVDEGYKVEYVSSYYQKYSKAYGELTNLNSDTVGWLTVNNTSINYPIVQAGDNDYYLNHAYDKTSNEIGWIFVDYRNNMDIIDKNIIIYGHSMVDGGLMFSTLKNTLNESWYNNDNNLVISFSIKGVDYKWKIFSIYVIENTNDYLYTSFSSDSSFKTFLNKIIYRSIKDFNVDIESINNILTLSTCYKDDDYRVVIHAYMM